MSIYILVRTERGVVYTEQSVSQSVSNGYHTLRKMINERSCLTVYKKDYYINFVAQMFLTLSLCRFHVQCLSSPWFYMEAISKGLVIWHTYCLTYA